RGWWQARGCLDRRLRFRRADLARRALQLLHAAGVLAQLGQGLGGDLGAGAGVVDGLLVQADGLGVAAGHVAQPGAVVFGALVGVELAQRRELARVGLRDLHAAGLGKLLVELVVVVLHLLREATQLGGRAAQLGRLRGLHFGRAAAQGLLVERARGVPRRGLPGGN